MFDKRPQILARFIRVSLLGLLVASVMFGCGEEGGPSNSSGGGIDGASLLGLENGRRLIYLRTDSIRDSDLNLVVTTAQDTFLIAGDSQDWSIGTNQQPIISLKISDNAIIQNGYWPIVGGNPQITYLPTPPVLIPRNISAGDSWGGYLPLLQVGLEEVQQLFYYSYFGFHHTKSYVAHPQVIVPAGQFAAYQFNTLLYQRYDDVDPIATVQEYYVPDIGMVRQDITTGGAFKRVLSLISYE